MKCNNLSHIYYKHLQESNDASLCISCCNKTFLFGTLTNKIFVFVMMVNCSPTTVKNNDANKINSDGSLVLKLSANLSLLFSQFNEFSPEQKNEPENVVNSNYFKVEQSQTLNFPENNKSLFLFHINGCSLNKN